MKKTLMVGITGRSGSGKSSVAQHYRRQGYPVADGDQLSREVCTPGSPCLAELVQHFGQDILAPDGSLRRRELSERVFASPGGNEKLLHIVHPYIYEAMLCQEEAAYAQGASLFFLDGAMIVGSMFKAHCNRLIVVRSQEKLAISRIILRDGISKAAAGNRLAAQLPDDVLCAAADYVIDNNASEAQLLQKADIVLANLLEEVN